MAIKSAIIQILSSKVLTCNKCHGFGVERCKLCDGRGAVNWEGKFAHQEPCPMCVGRRYTRCTECGGLYHRSVFQHKQRGFNVEEPVMKAGYDWDRRPELIYGD